MGMYYSGVQVGSFVVLLLGTAAIIVSIATNNWSKHEIGGSLAKATYYRGLIYSCKHIQLGFEGTTCTNRYEGLYTELKDNAQKAVDNKDATYVIGNVEAWDVGCLACMVASAVFGILALLTAPCCCHRCGCCLSSFVFFASLCSIAGIATYVYYTEQGRQIHVFGESFPAGPDAWQSHYDWSFFVAVGGAALQLIASILFCVGRGRSHAYTQQI